MTPTFDPPGARRARRHPLRNAAALAVASLAAAAAGAQDPAPADPPDPTLPDAAVRAALQGRGSSALPATPEIAVKGVVAAADGPPQVLVQAGGELVQLFAGKEWRAPGGAVLTVAELTDRSVTIEHGGIGTRTRVDLGPPTRAPSAPDRLARIDLRGVPLASACRLIADQVGRNVVASSGAASVSVELYVQDITVTDAIRTLCDAYQLWFREDPATGVVSVSTVDEYKRDLTDIQQEETRAFTLRYPNVFDVGHAIRDLFGERVELRISETQDDVFIDLSDRLRRFDLLDGRTQGFGQGVGLGYGSTLGAGSLGGALGGALGGLGGGFGGRLGGGYGGGYGGGSLGYGGGRLSSYDQYDAGRGRDSAAAERETLRGTLSAEEILRLEEAMRNFREGESGSNDLAEELARRYQAPIYVTAASRQNKLLVRTSDTAALAQIEELVRELDVPTALVLLELRILAVGLDDAQESFFEYQFASGSAQGEFATGDIAAPSSGLGPGGTGLRAEDLIFQYVDSTFAARLQVLESENRVQTLATPILLTANNEVSRLFVGREVPLNRSFEGGQTLVNEATTTTATGSTDIEFRPVGTTLFLTPNINADRSVTLRIVQENSDVNSTAEVLVPSGTDFVPQDVGVVSSQSVSGTIVAQDDRAVAFGGLIERGTTSDVAGIPYLRDIPYLGVLFRRTVEEQTRREIVIVVRPYVIGTPAEYSNGISSPVLRDAGVDVDLLHTDPISGDVLSPDAPFSSPRRFRVHGVDRLAPRESRR